MESAPGFPDWVSLGTAKINQRSSTLGCLLRSQLFERSIHYSIFPGAQMYWTLTPFGDVKELKTIVWPPCGLNE
jgi:hypothetical protein